MNQSNPLTSLIRHYQEIGDNTPIELLNRDGFPIGAIYPVSTSFKTIVVTDSDYSKEKYSLYADGILVFFSSWKKVTKKSE